MVGQNIFLKIEGGREGGTKCEENIIDQHNFSTWARAPHAVERSPMNGLDKPPSFTSRWRDVSSTVREHPWGTSLTLG